MKKIVLLLLVLSLCLSVLTACQDKKPETPTSIRISVLNGTTGFGIAKMIHDEKNNPDSVYTFSIESDASVITAALINGSVDMAALPTNAAATLYQKTQGEIQVLSINTLGVLYVMTNGDIVIDDITDLEGKTVYCPAQNPTFIFKALCNMCHVNVTVDNSYAQPADLRTALVSGLIDIAVLPEPMVTIAKTANTTLNIALDLTAVWNSVTDQENSLTQGCLVVRKSFVEQYPYAVQSFLQSYKDSIDFTNENSETASSYIAEAGIFEKAGVAKNAIPRCNLCYLDGNEMKTALESFLTVLYEQNPQSIGGKLPDEAFYYIPQ